MAISGVGGMTLGMIASFLQLSKSFSQPISQISQQLNMVVMALAGAKAYLYADGRGAGGGRRLCDTGRRTV